MDATPPLGGVQELAVGATDSTTIPMVAGKYVLFCNVLEKEAMANMAEIKAHYMLGMFAAFTVT